MKKSKPAKASKHKDKIDRISNLSDDILHLILSGLPTTEEVVRTSILSTRWRYLPTSFSYSSINIDFSRTLKSPSRFKINNFEEFMSRVLANESLDLDFFSLYCPDYHNTRTLGRWIDAAITRNVKLLHLMISHMDEFKVPDCLVTSGSLEVLKLFLSGSCLRLPIFSRLPSLRVLELHFLKLLDEVLVEEFLKSCPSLEELSLVDCMFGLLCISCPKLKNLRIDNRELNQHRNPTIVISCPKLVFWEVAGYVHHQFLIRNVDSLEKAVFHPQIVRISEEVEFAEITLPVNLSLGIFFNLEQPEPEEDIPPKTLEVTTTIDFLTKDALFCLLKGLQHLESLHLIIIKGPFLSTLYSYLGGFIMPVLTKHLKRVEFVDFNGEKENLFVARVLLEHGKVLEEMVFSWGNEVIYHEKSMEIMNEVSNFHKASSTVKLITFLNN